MFLYFLFCPASLSVHVCDLPSKYESLKSELAGAFHSDIVEIMLTCDMCTGSGLTVHQNGHLVSRISDFIIYSVEAEFIESVVKEFGPCMPIPYQSCFLLSVVVV